MNMFAKNNATTIEEYMELLPDDRKELIQYLHKFIQKTAPALKPHYAYNMIGYGSFDYVNYKKENIEWPIVALANQKNYISVYVCAVIGGKYVAETHKDELGKVSVGRSCIRFKKLEDVNLDALAKVIKLANVNPGLAQI